MKLGTSYLRKLRIYSDYFQSLLKANSENKLPRALSARRNRGAYVRTPSRWLARAARARLTVADHFRSARTHTAHPSADWCDHAIVHAAGALLRTRRGAGAGGDKETSERHARNRLIGTLN